MSAAATEANTLTRQLWHIAGSGDLEQLDELLSQGVNVNARDRNGVTALMRAAYHGQLAVVRVLIFYGADPSAKDRTGLTALRMAEYGGHEEIVEALRAIGAQGKREVAKKPAVVVSAREERFHATTDYEDSPRADTSLTARTLHEPLEIWEMVHTTQTESSSPFASPGRVLSTRIMVLAMGALLICSGVVFGFLALRKALSATENTSQQRAETTEHPLSTSKALTQTPGNIPRSSNELTKLKPVGESLNQRVDSPKLASSVSSAKKAAASQRPKVTKVSATVPRQNKNGRSPTKLEGEPSANSKFAKKDPAQPASDPVKPSTTQKPKVIQWPN